MTYGNGHNHANTKEIKKQQGHDGHKDFKGLKFEKPTDVDCLIKYIFNANTYGLKKNKNFLRIY